jgi:hypothetical protein
MYWVIFLFTASILLLLNRAEQKQEAVIHYDNIIEPSIRAGGDYGIFDYSDRGDFNKAFKQARIDNQDFFWWNNKLYSTKMEEY